MSDVKRKTNGQFAKGQSGNRSGRPRKKDVDSLMPAAIRRDILEVAAMTTEVRLHGKIVRMSLFKSNVLQLATGTAGNRLSAKAFIDLVKHASNVEYSKAYESARRMSSSGDELGGSNPILTGEIGQKIAEIQRELGERLEGRRRSMDDVFPLEKEA